MGNEIAEAGHDWVYDTTSFRRQGFLIMLCLVGFLALCCVGCAGGHSSYTREASGFGLLLEPLGSSPGMPRAAVGSFAVSGMVKPSDDDSPLLNRVAVEGAFGSQHKATQAAGPVGEELQKAGATLPAVISAEHRDSRTLGPFELPGAPSPSP